MNKGKILIAVSAAMICTAGLTTAAVIVCKKLYEKHYFSVNDFSSNF